MPHQKIMLAVLLAGLFASAGACADDGQAGDARPGTFTVVAEPKTSGPKTFTIFTDAAPRPIVNAPYSAQMVTEHQQNLADGNQIVDRQTSMSYRDSAGRTRQENFDSKGEPTTVTINDPVAGLRWVLNPRERVGVKLARSAMPLRIEQRKRGDGDSSARQEVIVKQVQRADDNAAMNVRIETPQAQAGTARKFQINMAPLTTSMFGDKKWTVQTDGKKLGTREIAGVQAEGTMHSYEIPAGQIGNRNPILVTDENWYAPDLQITVYTKHSDPRSGDVEFRIEKLKREEPPAALFTVPADYKVRDALAAAGGQGR
jgi:hypothetical protein